MNIDPAYGCASDLIRAPKIPPSEDRRVEI